MEYDDCVLKSSEQFYQYKCIMFLERNDIAHKVVDAATPRETKEVAAQLKSSEHSTNLTKWATIKSLIILEK